MLAARLPALALTVSACASPNPFVSDYRTHQRDDYIGPRLPIEAGDRVVVLAHRDGFVSTEIEVTRIDVEAVAGTLVDDSGQTVASRRDEIHRLDIARDSDTGIGILLAIGAASLLMVDSLFDDFGDSFSE